MTAAEDAIDVQRVLDGDTAAFEGIVRRWQVPMITLAYRFCHDWARAEDLAQEAFLRAYRSLRSWRQHGAFSTWLFAIALNHYRTDLRRAPPPGLPLDSADEVISPRADEASMSSSNDLQRAVAALPPAYRDAVILFYFDELDLAGAARLLQISEGAMKSRLFRARELLRKALTRGLCKGAGNV